MTINATRFNRFNQPVVEPLTIKGECYAGVRQISFGYDYVTKEGKAGNATLFKIATSDAKLLVEGMKLAIEQSKVAIDPKPVKKALAPTTSKPSDMSVEDLLKALQAQGIDLSSLKPKEVAKPVTPATPAKRGTTHSKPAEVAKPVAIPALDDLDEISTSELEAVSNIMAILLAKRGTK